VRYRTLRMCAGVRYRAIKSKNVIKGHWPNKDNAGVRTAGLDLGREWDKPDNFDESMLY